jgi:hypothetical protein
MAPHPLAAVLRAEVLVSCDRTGVLTLPRLARPTAYALVPLLVLALSSLPTQARQSERSSGRITIVGQVLDASTRQPVAAAAVELAGTRRQAFTDKLGRFALKDVPIGTYTVTVEQLGYAEGRLTQRFDESTAPIEIALMPDPVVLQTIQVTNDRLKRRRNAVAVSVFAYDSERLRRSSAFDVNQFVRQNAFAFSCPNPLMGSLCVRRRGRVIVPSVYIDESPVPGGAEFLNGLPLEDVYLVEIYSGGAHIRVYTNWFARLLAQGRVRLSPVLLF